jgi:hypothetical protein
VKLIAHQLEPRSRILGSIHPLPHTSSWHSYLSTGINFSIVRKDVDGRGRRITRDSIQVFARTDCGELRKTLRICGLCAAI